MQVLYNTVSCKIKICCMYICFEMLPDVCMCDGALCFHIVQP